MGKDITIKTINSQHAKLLDVYMSKIDETIYNATEGLPAYRYSSFETVKRRGIGMSNEMANHYIEDGGAEEWSMTLPNFLIFSVLGFLSGIKTEDNEKELEDITEELYKFHVKSIDKLTDIGYQFELKRENDKLKGRKPKSRPSK